jgi:hypothetical protein
MNFLKYIELSAENLQFFLWYRDYSKRFNALPESERVLSPEWTGEKNAPSEAMNGPKYFNADTAAILQGTDFASQGKLTGSEKSGSNPFFTPPRTPNSVDRPQSLESFESMTTGGKVDHTQRASGAFENAGLKWKPREYKFANFLRHL